jgi:outer membrane murein-binding lipoprotein Lpp
LSLDLDKLKLVGHQGDGMDKKPIIILAVILGVVILLVLVLGGSAIGSYNTLVTKQQEVNAKWSQVEKPDATARGL